jgi:hypothetical protein
MSPPVLKSIIREILQEERIVAPKKPGWVRGQERFKGMDRYLLELDAETKNRLERLRSHPEEPYGQVISRLIDAYEDESSLEDKGVRGCEERFYFLRGRDGAMVVFRIRVKGGQVVSVREEIFIDEDVFEGRPQEERRIVRPEGRKPVPISILIGVTLP